MRRAITAAILVAFAIPAQAYPSHHRNRHAVQRKAQRAAYKPFRNPVRSGGGMITISTDAGRITVNRGIAPRFQALIADFVAHGYRPRSVGCLAHRGHVPNSRHYAGAACDFDQTGRGKTSSFMYHAHAIIVRHGLRDGCDFGDCGHVDDGQPLHYARGRGRVSRRAFSGI